VVRVALRDGQAVERGFDFGGAFSAAALRPSSTVPQLDGFASVPDLAVLALFDRHARQVVAVVPTGREPEGVALEPAASRIYVALPAEDQLQVLDLATGDEVRRIPLYTGDRPSEIALVSGNGPILTVNSGTDTASFVDPISGVIIGRVQVGQEPWALLLDQQGRRAYVLDRRSSDITVLDISTHQVAARIQTDAEPIRAALNRAGTRLFVVHRGSAYMNVYSVPGYAQQNRIFVGLGAGTVRVDPRSDLVYVGRADEGVIQIFDPSAALPVGQIDVDGPVAWLALDATENVLLAGIPSLGRVAFVDLTTRRQVSAIDVGRAPYQVIVPGERF
jgi:YVTN family beta-propeller protein